jgi:hypothetical protein
VKYKLTWPQIAKVAGFGYKVVGSIDSKPLNKLNLKVRYLMFVALMTDPQAVLDSLLNLRKGFTSLELQERISAFVWSEYQRNWASYRRFYDKIQSVRFGPFMDLMKQILPLKEQKLLYHNIFWAIYQPVSLRASRRYWDGMDQLQKIFFRGTYARWTTMERIEAFLELIKVDAETAAVGSETFNTTRHQIVSNNPQVVRMFKIHTAFARVLSKSKDLLNTPTTYPEPLMSGFVPLAAFKVLPRLLPRAIKNIQISKMIWMALRRRFLWTIGFTGVMSIASWFHGVPFVIGILLTI